jgi:type II secretory pathway predicted ATPase ExeA
LLARDYYQVRTATVSNPKLPFDGLLRDVMRQLGISSGSSRVDMLDAFDRFLSSVEPGGRVVIVVDEAQALGDDTLEEVRLLSNRNGSEENRLQFILIGQRELAQRLLAPGLRQLNDRIGARAILNPMTRDDAFGYVDYCMRTGGGSARRVFRRRALSRIVDHGGGLPRRLNVLCHNAMLMAYAWGHRNVKLEVAKTAAAEYENRFASAHSSGGARLAAEVRRLWFWAVKPEPQTAIRPSLAATQGSPGQVSGPAAT